MSPSKIEDLLVNLGQKWPVPSVAEAVMARIDSESISRPAPTTARAWRMGLWASAAAVSVAVGIALVAILSAPRTLQAQVERDLARTTAAHITIRGLDEQGVRREANIWYSRERGFRMESAEQIIVDDGRQQWEWQPGLVSDETLVVRRPSGDGRQMLSEMFAMKDVPADWKQHRAAEHDREIAGEKCQGYVVTPPAVQELSEDGRGLTPARNPVRIIVWTDRQDRIVQMEEQRQVQGQWQSGRQTSIRYEAEVPAERFAANLPARAKVVNADASLEERFPLAAALATKESQGLLFAIHEAQRMEGGMIYIVSSVRGTPAYLKAHPHVHRRFNLTTTHLDVAIVPDSAGNIDGDWNRASLASAQHQGVCYSWWIAVPRRYYAVKDGVEVPRDRPAAGRAIDKPQITLFANPYALRDSRGVIPSVSATLELSPSEKAATLQQIAAHVLHDATLLTAHGVGVGLMGGIDKHTQRSMNPHGVDADQYVVEIRSQLAWLHSLDEAPVSVEPAQP